MMQRFAKSSNDLILSLLPHYKTGLIQGRTSFRPRKSPDDRLLGEKTIRDCMSTVFRRRPVQDEKNPARLC